MSGTSSPVLRHHVTTSDPDEAIAHQQGFTRFRAGPIAPEGFWFSLGWVSIDAVTVSHMQHEVRIDANSEPPKLLTVAEALRGSISVTDRTDEDESDVLLIPHWSQYRAAWSGTTRITSLDPAEVGRIGAAISGLDPAAVRFGSMRPLSAAHARYWTATVDHVDRQVLAHDDLMASPLVRSNVVHQLVSGLLAVFPNSTLDRRPEARPTGEPATVRRAVEFIDSHAQDDIDITRIAEAARIGPRGLQQAFRRHRGQTPTEYLRRVRLAGAHRELQDADPTRGDTVAAIAARWGFTHPGRFSVEYRRTYDRSPSDTLRG